MAANMSTNKNQDNSLIKRLYSDLFLYCNKKKIPFFFKSAFNDTILLKDAIEIPLEFCYNPYKTCKNDGCKNSIESISDYIDYYLITEDGKKIQVTSDELLMLEETLIESDSELERLQVLTEILFNTLYYFFNSYDLKLISIKLKFIKSDIFNGHKFICYFDLEENPLYLTKVSDNKKVNIEKLLTILYPC